MVADLFDRASASFSRDAAGTRKLLLSCAEQISHSLVASLDSPSHLRTLASYFTRVEPFLDDRPFCVALADVTLLFYMQMARIPESDVNAYAQLVLDALSLIPAHQHAHHPFVTQVVRDCIFGLPSATCAKAHCVVLVPPHQYNAFARLVTVLTSVDAVPHDIVLQWHQQLELFAQSPSPMVSFRSQSLLVRTLPEVDRATQVAELQSVLRLRRVNMNTDQLLSLYERLQRVVPDPSVGSASGRALSIHCSELFLRFRTPIRREYLERYLYPSLCSPDMLPLVTVPQTRQHLTQQLLRHCSPSMGHHNAFYMCLCAIIHTEMADEVSAALEFLRLFQCQMPHAAYFIATLATDSNMAIATFAKTLMVLNRSAGMSMLGRAANAEDEVASVLGNDPRGVYNILFMLRQVASQAAAATASRRSEELIGALRKAVPAKTIDALGRLSTEAFRGRCDDIVLDPQLLCAELGMVLHELNIDAAIDDTVEHLRQSSRPCPYCWGVSGKQSVCPVNGSIHVEGREAARRVLTTLTECSGTQAVRGKFTALLRDPATQMDGAVHMLIHQVLSHAGPHRLPLFRHLEPYLRNTLVTLLAAETSAPGSTTSLVKANVMSLHARLAVMLNTALEPSYVQSALKVLADLPLNNNHDALGMWYVGNLLLRHGKGNVELLPADPQENQYCINHPGCAPTNHVSADNAQLLLQLLDKCLGCSPEMRRLTGLTVCRLIQDFNMQAPNIVSSLLNPCGFVPSDMTSLNMYCLPVGAESTFWQFILRQLRGSAPARTAFMTTVAKSMAQRFRHRNPSQSLSLDGNEPTAPVFTVWLYEALKRNAPLSRSVTHILNAWVKQKKHTPGKFMALWYCCLQVCVTVQHRHVGRDPLEEVTEDSETKAVFDQSVQSGLETLLSQLERAARLVPETSRSCPPFCRLLKKMHVRVRRFVSDVTHRPLPAASFDAEMARDDEVEDPHFVSRGRSQSQRAGGIELHQLHEPADDDVFDVQADGGNDDELNDYDGGEPDDASDSDWRQPPAGSIPQIRLNSTMGHNTNTTSFDASAIAMVTDTSAPMVSSIPTTVTAPQSAAASRPLTANLLHPHTAAPSAPTMSTAAVQTTNLVNAETNTSLVLPDTVSGSATKANTGTAAGGSAQKKGAYYFQRDLTEESMPSAAAASQLQQQQQQQWRPIHHAERDHDEDQSSRGSSFLARSVSSSASSANRRLRRLRPEEHHDEERPSLNVGIGNKSTVTPLPRLQNAGNDFVVPSHAVLDYLMNNQATDSTIHELRQFDPSWLQQQAMLFEQQNAYHAPHRPYVPQPMQTIATIQMDATTNNYSAPHSLREPAPLHTVTTTLTMREQQQQQQQHRVDSPHRSQHGGGLPSVSALKKRRVDGALQSRVVNTTTADPAAWSVLKELQAVQYGSASGGFEGEEVVDDRITPHRRQYNHQLQQQQQHIMASENVLLPVVTPHLQRVLPTCLVEQNGETTLRELQQVMGLAGPSSAGRPSSSAKRSTTRPFNASTFEGVDSDSRGWWATTSSAPMPTYAEDPNFSLELF